MSLDRARAIGRMVGVALVGSALLISVGSIVQRLEVSAGERATDRLFEVASGFGAVVGMLLMLGAVALALSMDDEPGGWLPHALGVALASAAIVALFAAYATFEAATGGLVGGVFDRVQGFDWSSRVLLASSTGAGALLSGVAVAVVWRALSLRPADLMGRLPRRLPTEGVEYADQADGYASPDEAVLAGWLPSAGARVTSSTIGDDAEEAEVVVTTATGGTFLVVCEQHEGLWYVVRDVETPATDA